MTRKSMVRRGVRQVALLGLVWLLLLGQGLGGSAPEPLQNRQQSPEGGAEDHTEAKPGVVVQPGATASGAGGNQESTVIVTPPAVGVTPTGPGVVVPTTPGVAVPVETGKIQPGAATPVQGADQTGKDSGAPSKATVTGGNQDTKVIVTPPATGGPAAVVPDKTVVPPVGGPAAVVPDKAVVPSTGGPALGPDGKPLGPGVAVPGQAVPAVPGDGKPFQVAPDGRVLDAAGKPVDVPTGQEVVLPKGGKIVDGQGHVVVVPPGGRVIVPPLTPGHFLPKVEPPKNQAKRPPHPEKANPPAKPVPDKTPKPQTQVAPKSGDRFKISQDACEKHTVDFLQGCWQGRHELSDRTRAVTRLCFDANGDGKRIDKETNRHKELVCVAPMKASWSGNKLLFSFHTFRCSDGRPRTDVPVVCSGCGDRTECIGSEYREGRGMIGKTHYEIVKE